MSRYILVVGLFLQACATTPDLQHLHISHCAAGCPAGSPASNEIIVRHLFAVSVNPDRRHADWVAYRVLAEGIGVASLLPREWQDDHLMAHGVTTAELQGEGNRLAQSSTTSQQDSAYRVTEFLFDPSDLGHLVPMTSFAGTTYWSDVNLLSVMSPMKGAMRLESWSRLDQSINRAAAAGPLFVVVGPVANRTADAGVLPSAFYKVVANEAGEAAAFLFDQDLPAHAAYCDQLTDLQVVESITGLDLFPRAGTWPTGSLAGALGCP